MSDSDDYSDDESLSSLNLDNSNLHYDSDFDSDFDDDSSLSSLNIGGKKNNQSKQSKLTNKTNQTKKSKKSKKSLKLSRLNNIDNNNDNNNDDNNSYENDDEILDDDANEELLNDNDNNDNDSDSDNDSETEINSDDDNIDTELDDNDDDNILKNNIDTDIKNKVETQTINNHHIIIDKNNRISRPYLTKYEYVRCLGERTQQITAGAKVMIKNADELLKFKTPEEIAKLEIKEKCCPYIIIRPLPNNKEEHWDINELDILFPIT